MSLVPSPLKSWVAADAVDQPGLTKTHAAPTSVSSVFPPTSAVSADSATAMPFCDVIP
jgi:hypothetical protein